MSINDRNFTPAELVNMTGKSVLVTGAASGIGQAQARLFAAAGAKVIAADIDEAVRGVFDMPGVTPVVADLTQDEGVAALCRAVGNAVDVLCNTAGRLDGWAASLETDEALWDRIFDTNVKAIFRLTNALLPGMIAHGGGVIINMSSVGSMIAGGGGAAYTASKHAVVGYTRQLANDYGRQNIRVNAICPGMIETSMTKAALENERLVKVLRSVPAGRLGRPEDIAALSLFLAGPGASFIHGAAIFADGGLTIR